MALAHRTIANIPLADSLARLARWAWADTRPVAPAGYRGCRDFVAEPGRWARPARRPIAGCWGQEMGHFLLSAVVLALAAVTHTADTARCLADPRKSHMMGTASIPPHRNAYSFAIGGAIPCAAACWQRLDGGAHKGESQSGTA